MYTIQSDGSVRFSRPYPFDLARRQHIERIMRQHGITTVTDLAKKTKIKRTILNESINGTRLSYNTEKRLAAFFGMEREALFIIRSASELMAMFDAEEAARNKQGAA